MIDLEGLDPEFRAKLVALIRDCLANDIKLDVIKGAVSVHEQAKLWRRSRTDNEIDHGIFELQQEKCLFLADVLRKANVPFGVAVTDKLPGFCWQNYGEQVEIANINDKTELAQLKKIAKKHDLSISEAFSENLLIHKSPFVSPLQVYTAKEIDKLMSDKWGNYDSNIN